MPRRAGGPETAAGGGSSKPSSRSGGGGNSKYWVSKYLSVDATGGGGWATSSTHMMLLQIDHTADSSGLFRSREAGRKGGGGGQIDLCAADIFSLGVVLWEIGAPAPPRHCGMQATAVPSATGAGADIFCHVCACCVLCCVLQLDSDGGGSASWDASPRTDSPSRRSALRQPLRPSVSTSTLHHTAAGVFRLARSGSKEMIQPPSNLHLHGISLVGDSTLFGCAHRVGRLPDPQPKTRNAFQ